jgi:MFS family permease
LASHSLIRTLKSLRGNVRGAVYTEALWGIPFNLYAPYVSVYMLALGMNDAEIGLIATISTAFQVFWTLMAGAITDKLGRKRTTLTFDLISWSLPCVIWAVAQNFTYFLVAAFFNALWRVTDTSWQCLLVEDTDPDILVDVWSWINIAGRLAAFVAPLAGLLVAWFGLVPTMRGLYVLAVVMMTSKALTMNALVTETQQGKVRMKETADVGLFTLVGGLGKVFRLIIRSRATLYTFALMVIVNIVMTVQNAFWSVLVSRELGVSDAGLAAFPVIRSLTMLTFFFVGMPLVKRWMALTGHDERVPMIGGFLIFVVSQVILTLCPTGVVWPLVLATFLEGCCFPLISTHLAKLTAITVDPQERARIMSMLSMGVLIGVSPFGWLAGQLSSINRRYPFVLVSILLALAAIVTYFASRSAAAEAESSGVTVEVAQVSTPAGAEA